MDIKWKVADKPTGKWRSFDHRAWPSAEYKNANKTPCAQIISDDDYTPDRSKKTDLELKVMVADHSQKPWKWSTLARRFSTLADAKAIVPIFLKQNPTWVPANADVKEE